MAHGVSPEVFLEAMMLASEAPDPRMDRVDMAVARLNTGIPDSHDLAQAMISGILAESGN